MRVAIVSFYGPNISRKVVEYQRKIFSRYPGDCTFQQIEANNYYVKDNVTYGHGTNIDNFVRNTDADIFIIFDIDCIPLDHQALPYLINYAAAGTLVGVAQRSNHIENNQHIFVGAPCIAFSRETYLKIGQPSAEPTPRGDTAEELTYKCEELGVPVVMAFPIHSDTHQWDLRDGIKYGFGTTYEYGLYHQFCSRHNNQDQAFIQKCKDVLGEKTSTLIITAAVGYHQTLKTEFLFNLQETGYEGHVEILDWKPVGFFGVERIKAYRDKIASVQDKGYRTIITTDLRDVVFQGNPEGIQHSNLDFYLEDESVRIGACVYNSKWIREAFGDEVLAEIGGKRISCAGVVIGTPAAMLDYYTKMQALAFLCKSDGGDQGIHNYLLYKKMVEATAIDNEAGSVYTVGYVDGIQVKAHKIYNKAGQVPVIVHQFDRHLRRLK